ncbi:adenylate cyclase [Sinorhizobium fredii NGR234]|uniref:Adenylate cyclase n=1 Tax=Sinorhizobium fredii (strain NBRC 101917 / NGR234) TaxID=394 RepID=C3MDU9_SINFN|nr:adenylate cyclase [Sinorhizobium fredii NGR234]
MPISYRGLLLLETFARHPGEVLRKADLLEAAWPGLAVEESNLSVQIAALRKRLGSAPDGVEWIATIPRVGYRFTAEVQRCESTDRGSVPLPDRPSIAVLPFCDMSDDLGHAGFANGLTEDVITDLSRIPDLYIIARNSSFAYRDQSLDVRRIAQELGVRYLLEGSVRLDSDRVRINAQLIDAIGGGHLWAERFDRSLDDIFAVQDEVAGKIVEALVGRLTIPPPDSPPTA